MRAVRWLAARAPAANLLLPLPGVFAVMLASALHGVWWAVALTATQEVLLVSALRLGWTPEEGEG